MAERFDQLVNDALRGWSIAHDLPGALYAWFLLLKHRLNRSTKTSFVWAPGAKLGPGLKFIVFDPQRYRRIRAMSTV